MVTIGRGLSTLKEACESSAYYIDVKRIVS